MSRNLLLREYLPELAQAAALFGCDGGTAGIRDNRASWDAPLQGVAVDLELIFEGPMKDRYLVPVVRIGASRALPQDPLIALVMLEDAKATILRTVGALAMVQGIRVWLDAAPCDECSGKGTSNQGECGRCKGEGKRFEKEPT